jgi:hypothetical protein
MKRILSYLLITTVVLSLGMVIARRIGAAQPPSSFALMFTNPDGTLCNMPCMFGIRVGETTEKQAIKLIQIHPLTRNLTQELGIDYARSLTDYSEGDSVVIFAGSIGGVFLRISKEKIVSDIDWSFHEPQKVGDVVALLGAPHLIRLNQVFEWATLFYYSKKLLIHVNWELICNKHICEQRLKFQNRIEHLSIRATYRLKSLTTDIDTTWHGFSHMGRYLTPTPQP